jgi:hypothetical protein
MKHRLVAQSLESGERKVLWTGGSDARYVPPGYLIYALATALFALPPDLDSMEVRGGPVPIVEDVLRVTNPAVNTATANYGLAERGTLIYVEGGAAASQVRDLISVDRQGKVTPLIQQQLA